MIRFLGTLIIGCALAGTASNAAAQGSGWTGDRSRMATVDAIVADARSEVRRETSERGCAANNVVACVAASQFYRTGSRTTPANATKGADYMARAEELGRAACSMDTAKGRHGCGDLGFVYYMKDPAANAKRGMDDSSDAIRMLKTGCTAQNGTSCHMLGQISAMHRPRDAAAGAAAAAMSDDYMRKACSFNISKACIEVGLSIENAARLGNTRPAPEGAAQKGAGKREDARYFYERALALDPDSDTAADLLDGMDTGPSVQDEEEQRLIDSGFTPEQVRTAPGG